MSIANSTLHFHFPLVTGTDRPLFEDYNQTMETLDEKLYESISTLETIPQEITDLQTAVNGLGEQIAALETFETEQTGTNQLVNNAILALQQATAVIPTKFDSAGIADPYDAEHGTYSVGDVVTHNGQRYECSQAVTAAEPFDADKWTAIDVQTVISAIKTVVGTIDAKFTGTALTCTWGSIVGTSKRFHAQKLGTIINVEGFAGISGAAAGQLNTILTIDNYDGVERQGIAFFGNSSGIATASPIRSCVIDTDGNLKVDVEDTDTGDFLFFRVAY